MTKREKENEIEASLMTKTECSCEACQRLCTRNPGWMTPEEAKKAIDAGLAEKLMCDWLDPSEEVGNTERIFLLCPASDYRGGEMAPEWEDMHGYTGTILDRFYGDIYKGRCIFFDGRLCTIHTSGFKPKQCRTEFGCDDEQWMNNYDMARLWFNDACRQLVKDWQKLVGLEKLSHG
jgi:Fe-S-cluster containining protein